MKPRADATLDTFGTLCPVPIHMTRRKMEGMRRGAVLEVLSDDVGILTDMPAWCKAIGNEIVHTDQADGQYRYYIRKLDD